MPLSNSHTQRVAFDREHPRKKLEEIPWDAREGLAAEENAGVLCKPGPEGEMGALRCSEGQKCPGRRGLRVRTPILILLAPSREGRAFPSSQFHVILLHPRTPLGACCHRWPDEPRGQLCGTHGWGHTTARTRVTPASDCATLALT